jgi:replication initiation and membrane attachment protein
MGRWSLKLQNLLQLTELHTYAVVRRFGLSPMDIRMIQQVYQPIVGAFAAALYHTFNSHLPSDAIGRSGMAPLSGLFLACGLEPNERGRKRLVEETSKLEAVGLLRSYRRVEADGDVSGYEFRLEPPLSPYDFFEVHHLWLFLKEKLGPNAAEAVRRSFFSSSADESPAAWEELSAPFYDVFRMTVPAGSEQAIREAAPAKEAAAAAPVAEASHEFGRDGFPAGELLARFPRSSRNRRHVERILTEPALLAEINYYAAKFELTMKQTVSLLDEEGMFLSEGRLNVSRFEAGASELFLKMQEQEQGRDRLRSKMSGAAGAEATGRESDAPSEASSDAERAQRKGEAEGEKEVPRPYWLEVPAQFVGECDQRQYNALLANAPYTRVLKLFFEPAAVPGAVQEAFLAMNVNYRLPDEVINVLIHYIRTNDLDWTRGFLEAIAGNVAGKHIRTFENAVVYFRKAAQIRGGGERGDGGASGGAERKPAGGTRRSGGSGHGGEARRGRPSKPVIPVVKKAEGKAASEEDIQRILDMARELDSNR